MKKLLGIISVIVIAIIFFIKPCFALPVTISLNSGISYQDEGTLKYDDTTELKSLDSNWAPTPTGTVIYDYYATGTSNRWFDGISANFDLSSVGYLNITSATLRAYIKTGAYGDHSWHHYKLYPNEKNSNDEDVPPPFDSVSFGYNEYLGGKWISHNIPLDWITDDNLYVSLRLWNASADQVKLTVDVVPEPASLSLLGFGLLGLLGIKRKRKKL